MRAPWTNLQWHYESARYKARTARVRTALEPHGERIESLDEIKDGDIIAVVSGSGPNNYIAFENRGYSLNLPFEGDDDLPEETQKFIDRAWFENVEGLYQGKVTSARIGSVPLESGVGALVEQLSQKAVNYLRKKGLKLRLYHESQVETHHLPLLRPDKSIPGFSYTTTGPEGAAPEDMEIDFSQGFGIDTLNNVQRDGVYRITGPYLTEQIQKAKPATPVLPSR